MMHSSNSVGMFWGLFHAPIHLFGLALFAIGVIALTIWMIKAERKQLLQIGIGALVIAILSGYLITGSWQGMRATDWDTTSRASMMNMMHGVTGSENDAEWDEHMDKMHELMHGHEAEELQ